VYKCIYVYTTFIVLSVVKICSIYNVNSKLAVELQSTSSRTNRITLKISKKGHTSSVHLGDYVNKMSYYYLILYNSKYVQPNKMLNDETLEYIFV